MTFSARLGIEGGRDISQAGPDMFVTLSKHFWWTNPTPFQKFFGGGGGQNFSRGVGPPSPRPLGYGPGHFQYSVIMQGYVSIIACLILKYKQVIITASWCC